MKFKTVYLCYRSIGNPPENKNLRVVSTRAEAKKYCTQCNGGRWHGKISQASPYFFTGIKMAIPATTYRI